MCMWLPLIEICIHRFLYGASEYAVYLLLHYKVTEDGSASKR